MKSGRSSSLSDWHRAQKFMNESPPGTAFDASALGTLIADVRREERDTITKWLRSMSGFVPRQLADEIEDLHTKGVSK